MQIYGKENAMNSLFKVILIGFVGIVFVGCGFDGISKEAKAKTGLMDAPNWVIQGNDGGYSAVGDAPIINKNIQFARSEATASARGELVKKIIVKTTAELKKESVRDNDSLSEKVTSIVNEFAKQNIQGVGAEKTWIDSSGTRLYVLVRLSKEDEKTLKMLLGKQFKDLESFDLDK